MYEYEAGGDGFLILDENGSVVATATVEADAREVVAALNLVSRAAEEFPGLVSGEEEVNGGDLVDLFGDCLAFDAEGRYRERGQAYRCRACGNTWDAAELDRDPDVVGPLCPDGGCGSGDLAPYEGESDTP
jgi:hypothetical protein